MTDSATAAKLEGVIAALAIPMFEDGRIDTVNLEKQLVYLTSSGIRGLFLGGTTSEGAYLSTEEKLEIFRTAKRIAPSDKILCAACIQPSTRQVVDEMRAFAALGPDYIVAVTPYYMSVSQAAIAEHFRILARESPAPLIMYNIPQNTHNPMALDTVMDLASVGNIAGIKDSSGDFISFTRGVLGGSGEPFTWIQGEDLLDGPAYLVGAKAVVTGLSNVCVDPYLEIAAAAARGDLRAAMEMLGRGRRNMRLPGLTLGDDELGGIRKVLVSQGLLGSAHRFPEANGGKK
ncbi:MAG: dihydrodipicolinate synthase family protein [Spirochaetes bacterium]|nr:dihydrodipicolinate synthase family protein [Spirochaetota bacterium]